MFIGRGVSMAATAFRLKARFSSRLALIVAVALGATIVGGGCSGDGSGPAGPSNSIVVSVAPALATVQIGTTLQLAAAVAGTSNPAVIWRSSSDAIAAVDATGRVRGMSAGTATINAASQADPARTGSATLTVLAAQTPISIAVSPASVSLVIGGSQQLAVAVTGTPNSAVTWASNAPAIAAVDASGRVTATGVGTAIVTATSSADVTKSASATVLVTQPIRVALSSLTLSLDVGGSAQLSASVSGTTNQAVT
jgi:uncharacterized protein YjdB